MIVHFSDALNDHFDISVNHVVFTDDYERGQCCLAYNYTVSEDFEEADSEDGSHSYRGEGNEVIEGASFHLPQVPAMLHITEPFVDYVGDEYQRDKNCSAWMS
jgi:hypothetical protein